MLLQVHRAEVGRLKDKITLRDAAASTQQTEIRSLQEQLSDSTSKVLSLSQDLSAAEESHTKAVQVLLRLNHNHL